MKIIHAADLHIGSKFLKVNDEDKQKELIASLDNSFKNMVDYATRNNIHKILLSGDTFDKDKVIKKNKEYFYSIIKNHPNIQFYYIKGNHDIKSDYVEDIPNLFLFKENDLTTSYKDEINHVTILGYEINEDNKQTLYDMISLSNSYYNIILLHGDIFSKGKDFIDLTKLKGKNINYFALGHIHQRSVDNLELHSKYAYPGCLCGRGFDETGDKGFLVLDTESTTVEFVKNDTFFFKKKEYDVSSCHDNYELVSYLENDIKANSKELFQIILKGRIGFELDLEVIRNALYSRVYFLDIKNDTQKALTIVNDLDPHSLKGSFINLVKEDVTLTDAEKEEIMNYGLSKILRKE